MLSDGKHRMAIFVVDASALYEDNFNHVLEVFFKQHNFVYVTLFITHTHSGIFSEEHASTLNQIIVDAVLVANHQLTPVKIGASQTLIDESYNRIVHTADGVKCCGLTLTVLKLEQ